MKKIFILLIIASVIINSAVSFAYSSNEKRAYENLEVLMLRENYEAVLYESRKFLREFPSSRLKHKVKKLNSLAEKKLEQLYEKKESPVAPAQSITPQEEIFYIVQVGVFRKYSNVKKLKTKLKRQGFESVILKVWKSGKVYYRICAGKFKNLDNAKRLARNLKRKGHSAEIIAEVS